MSEFVVDLTGVPTKAIKDMTSSDALACLWGLPVREQIVRCRDCKHYEWREHLGRSYCHGEYPTEPDGFCAWGVSKVVDE